jgi:hypothetical protein
MKTHRAPYARRSAWIAIAVLSIVLVVACVVAGYEINHLQNEVNGLQSDVTNLYQQMLKSAKH